MRKPRSEVTATGKELQRQGFRITSIIRPAAPSSGHSKGTALDVADWAYHTGYGLRDAKKVLDTAKRVAPQHPWVAVAEDDHVHLEMDRTPTNMVGLKNAQTQGQLQLERGDPMSTMDKAYKKLGIARFNKKIYEYGDVNPAEPSELLAPGVNRLAVALNDPTASISQDLIDAAQQGSPNMLKTAQQVRLIRNADARQILYAHVTNGEVWTSSIGKDACLSPPEIPSAAHLLASGLPPFEPRNFDWVAESATVQAFYPSFAISQANLPVPGPLPVGEIFTFLGLYITITKLSLVFQAGAPVTLRIQYGAPGSLPQPEMLVSFTMSDNAEPTNLSIICGALSGGHAVMQPRMLQAQPGTPVPGSSYPRIALEGLGTSIVGTAYQVFTRFFRLGDYSIDRFGQILNG